LTRPGVPAAMVSYHPEIAIVLVGGVALISLALAVMARRAHVKTRNPKLGYVTAAFAVFFLKSIITAYALLRDPNQTSEVQPGFILTHGHLEFLNSALDLVIVALLIAPFLRRP
jgi:hypothetical protein